MNRTLSFFSLGALVSAMTLAACVVESTGSADPGSTDPGNDSGTTDPGTADSGIAKGPLTCADIDRTQVAQEMPKKAESLTLSGVYKIDGRYIYDGGEKITIEAGTVFIMGPDSRLYAGWRSDPASIFANGTAEKPILFCGSKDEPGHWQDIQLLTGITTDSYLEHVRIENAGGSNTSDAVAALLLSNAIKLANVSVAGSTKLGMQLAGLRDNSDNLMVTGSATNPLKLTGDSAISNLPEGSYTGNGEDVILVSGYGNTNVHFKDRGVPYRQLDQRLIFGSAGGPETSIRLDPGVQYQFCQDCTMLLGWRSDPGAIYAAGTTDKPIVFTSSQAAPKAGDWNGIEMLTGMKSDSVMSHVEFHYAGKPDGQAILISGGRGSLDNLTIADSAGAGIRIKGNRDSGLTLGTVTYTSNAEDLVEGP